MNLLWRCLKCGNCCRSLIGKRFGAALLPDEFRRLNAFSRRHGIDFNTKPLIGGILGAQLYQFTQEVCPFLDGNQCRVYGFRPLICQMFPLHPNGVMRCTGIEEIIKKGTYPVFPESCRKAATRYAILVQPLIEGATMVYSLDDGWTLKNRFPALQIRAG